MPQARVLLLHNEPVLPANHPDAASEYEILEVVEDMEGVVRAAGYKTERLSVGNDLQRLIDGLIELQPDAVFNLFEGLADRPSTEAVVAGILEWFHVSFTGSPSETLALARDKQRTKLMLRGAGLPTAPFFVVEHLPVPKCTLKWPVIVKPAMQDASIGIDQSSVVTNREQLEKKVEYVLAHYGPVLVEQFIDGREFQVSLIEGAPDERGRCEPLALPLAEIVFNDKSLWPIYSYTAKWAETSNEYLSAPLTVPVIIRPDWLERINDVARRAYRLLNCRDYARVDMRVDASGEPYVLEVNPNPFINSLAMSDGLSVVGLCHDRFVADLVEAALGRRDPRAAAFRGRLIRQGNDKKRRGRPATAERSRPRRKPRGRTI
jgi:D-alanine-D-alanine ligase